MKKLLFIISVGLSIVVFTQCRSAKNSRSKPVKLTYANNIQPILADKCTPCHFPDKGGRVKALNTYDAVKSNIDDIIHRIELHPGDKGFMPFKRPRLSDSTINVIKQWRDGGAAE